MQLAYELLPVWAGQDDKLPTAISHLRHCSHAHQKRHPLCAVDADLCDLLQREKAPTAKRAKAAKESSEPRYIKQGSFVRRTTCDAGRT